VERQVVGTTGVPHRVRPTRWSDAAPAYAELVGLSRPVALFVGSSWLPRHVVLVLEGTVDGLRVYEPAAGEVVHVARERFVDHRLALAGWDVPWVPVLPAR
jgi:hypothetical protein